MIRLRKNKNLNDNQILAGVNNELEKRINVMLGKEQKHDEIIPKQDRDNAMIEIKLLDIKNERAVDDFGLTDMRDIFAFVEYSIQGIQFIIHNMNNKLLLKEKQLADLREENLRLSQGLNAVNTSTDVTQELVELKTKSRVDDETIRRLNFNIDQLTGNAAQTEMLKNKVSQLEQQISTREKWYVQQIETREKAFEQLRKKLETQDEKMLEIQETIDSHESEKDFAIRDTKKSYAELIERMRAVDGEKNKTITKLGKQVKEHEASIRALTDAAVEYKDEIKKCKDQIQDKERASALGDIESKFDTLKVQYDQQLIQIQELKDKLKAMQTSKISSTGSKLVQPRVYDGGFDKPSCDYLQASFLVMSSMSFWILSGILILIIIILIYLSRSKSETHYNSYTKHSYGKFRRLLERNRNC